MLGKSVLAQANKEPTVVSACRVTVSPLQILNLEAVILAFTKLTYTLSVAVQPAALLTVTLYMPLALAVRVAVVSPLLHAYLAKLPGFNIALSPHTFKVSCKLGTGNESTTIVTESIQVLVPLLTVK